MTKIMVISDSHANNDWTKISPNYDYVIHAGDHLNSKDFMMRFSDQYVDGNNDFGQIKEKQFQIENLHFLLVHGDTYDLGHYENPNTFKQLLSVSKSKKVDVIIFGHTHIPIIKMIDNILFLNPGSIAKPRMMHKKSYIEIIVNDNKIKANLIYLD